MFRSLAIAAALATVSLPASADSLQYLLQQRAQQAQTAGAPAQSGRTGGSSALVRQNGENLAAGVRQAGSGHRAVVDQRGSDHKATVVQSGRKNTYIVMQRGQGGNATVYQDGTKQFGYLFQHTGKSGLRYEHRW